MDQRRASLRARDREQFEQQPCNSKLNAVVPPFAKSSGGFCASAVENGSGRLTIAWSK